MHTEFGCNRRKNTGIALFIILLVVLAVLFAFPGRSHAAETEATQSAETGGDIDTEASSALPGEAQITQILESAGEPATGGESAGEPATGGEGADEPATGGEGAGESATGGEGAGESATVVVTDDITDEVFTNDVLPEDPVNEAGGESLPEAEPFDVEANKGVIEELLTTTEESVAPQNAIQKAVDAALRNIEADTKEITVTVGAGVYEGDIEISARRSIETTTTTIYRDAEGTVLGNTQETSVEEETYVIPEDFWLRVVSFDAGDDLLSADDSVQVNGNIRISGMNVVLAGLYLSLNKRVTVTGDDGTAGPKAEIYGTKADDTIRVAAEGTSANPAAVTVHGGAGNDRIALDAGPNATATLNGGAGDDHIGLTSTYPVDADGTSAVTVNGGAGSDVVEADVTIANVVCDGEGVTGVTVNANTASIPAGGKEKDRLHFTGALSTDEVSEAVRKSDTQASFMLKNSGGETVRVLANHFASFTDALTNKRIARLNGDSMNDGNLCDYIDDLGDRDGSINRTLSGGGLLVNYMMRTSGDVRVERLQADSANVSILARKINVVGTVRALSFSAKGKDFTLDSGGSIHTAGDVLLTMHDDDAQFTKSSVPVLENLGVDVSGSLFDLAAASSIHILGAIDAGGNVALSAGTVQTRSLLDFTVNGANVADPVNFLNIKSGNAEISVPGSITAGGAVTAGASTAISFTVSPASIAGFTVPLSLSIAVSQVYVRVTGSVIGNGSVTLSADSDVTINTTALTGKIPVTIAVSIAAVDCHVLVGADNVTGTLVESKEGDVTLKSNGVTSMITKAKRGAESAGSTNVGVSAYFAAGVGVVDVSARIIGNANVRAVNGSVNIYSDSEERAVTDAVSKRAASATAGASDTGNPSIESIKNSLMAILESFRPRLGGKADAVLESVEGKNYAIYISDTVNGTISAVNKANAGQVITVTAMPNKGYKLQSVQYKHLPAGAQAYVFVPVLPDASGKYVITMPAFDINIVGTFVKKTASELGVTPEEYDGLYDVGGLFGGEDEANTPTDPAQDADEDGLGLTDLFNEGAGAAKPLDTSRATENSTSADAVTIAVADNVNNTASVVKGGSLLTAVTKADAGRTVAVTVNPTQAGATAAGSYRLKPGSLKFTYLKKSADATSASPTSLRATVDITADENGEYVFAVPADISDTDRTVTLHGEWELIPEGQTAAEPAPKASASMQITGALSFSVIVHRNSAVIATSGEVRADEVDLVASAVTSASATADATDALDLSVEEGVVPGATEAGAAATTGAQWVGGRDRLVLIEAMENGSLVYKPVSTNSEQYVFEVVPSSGYDIAERVLPGGAEMLRYATLHYTKANGAAGVKYLKTNPNGQSGTVPVVIFDLAAQDGVLALEGGYKKGTTLSVGTVFVVKDPATAASSGGIVNAEYAGNKNTIMIAGTTNGSVDFASSESSERTGKYAFTITPATGYRLGEIAATASSDPAAPPVSPSINFTYTYTKAVPASATAPASEATVKTSLTADGKGNYFFALPADAKPGTSIVIMAVFVADTRDIVLGTHENGTIAIFSAEGEEAVANTSAAATPATPGAPVVIAQAKAGDTVRFTATGANGFKPNAAILTYTLNGNAETTLTPTFEESTGMYSFTMPNADKGTQLALSCTFAKNDIPVAIDAVTVGESTASTAENLAAVTVNAARVDVGGEVVISLTEAGLAKGYKIVSVTGEFLNFAGDREEFDVGMTGSTARVIATRNADGTISFTIPAGAEPDGLDLFKGASLTEGYGYKLTVQLAEKALNIDVTASDRGAITLSNNKADAGDTISITLTPNEGYRTTDNSVSVTVIKPGKGGAAGTSETTKAARGTDGKYTFTVPEGAAGLAVAAEFMIGNEASNANGDSVSVGVAVTLAVTTHKNYAAIERGTVVANRVQIAARSGNAGNPVTSKTASYAGYTDADVGVGGAVSVHVAAAKTKALVCDTATLVFTGDNGGDVSIEAVSNESFATVADAAGKVGKGATAGVGAGIAVAVFGADVIAAVLDGTPIYHNVIGSADEVPLGSITITADHTLKETTDAKAGSAGGISATPVLAVHVSGADVQAYLGKAPTGNASLLALSGAAKVSATNRVNRQIAANAAAAGAKVGIGGSFAISLGNDAAIARVNRSLRAKNAHVVARSKSVLKSTSRAGANGTPSSGTGQKQPGAAASSDASESEADGQADGALGAAGRLSGSVGSNNCNGGAISAKSANRQKSQSTEGSVQVAAAFVLNIQINTSRAFIGSEQAEDGLISVAATDGVTIEAYNRTDSDISANASATKSQYGVGVAVAINVVTYRNDAFLGRATAKAGSLTVRADVWEEKTAAEKAETKQDKAEEQNFITRILRELIDEAMAAIGIEELFENEDGSENVIAKLIDDLTAALGKVAEDLVAGTGFEALIQGDDPYTKIRNNIDSFWLALKAIPDTLKSEFYGLLKELGYANVENADDFVATFQREMEGALSTALPVIGEALLKTVGDSVLSIIEKNLVSVVSNLGSKPPTEGVTVLNADGSVASGATTSVSNLIATEIKTRLIPGLLTALKGAMTTVITDLAGRYLPDSVNIETLLQAPMQSKLDALLDGPTSLIEKYAGALTDGIVDIERLGAFLSNGNIGLALQQNLKSALSNLGKALTNAAIDALTTVLDVKLAAEEVNERQHTIVTSAVSGAGATDVGVAGSLALAVVVGTTRASVLALDTMQNDDIVVTGDVLIEAYAMQNEDTTATSAISRDGTPNKNLGAGKGTDTATPERRTVDVGGFAEISLSPLGGSATHAEGSAGIVNVTLKPDEGYLIDTTVPITLRYTKLVGTTESEATVTVDVTENVSDGTYSFSIDKAAATGLKDGTKIIAVVDFKENLKNVVTLASFRNSETETAPAPSVNELNLTAPKQAKWGDTVQVAVYNVAGYRLDKVEYWYTAKGKTNSEPHKALTVKDLSAAVLNADVYIFYMPNVTDANEAGVSVAAYYTKLAETTGGAAPAASTQQKQDSGSSKSVGVGAAFALTVGTMEVIASVGENRRVQAATLSVTADGAHNGETVSVSGVDPIKGATEQPATTIGGTGGTAGKTSTTTKAATKAKDIAIDASAAVSLIYNNILAHIAERAVVTLTGASTIVVLATNADGEINNVDTGYQMIVRAAQQGETLTKASGFAVGNSTAVGAAVSVNIPVSTVRADFLGRAELPGRALITATTFDTDDSEGIATAVGADIDRMLQKYGNGVSTTEANANKLLSGEMFTTGPVSYSSNKNNKTASTVNGGLNGRQEAGGAPANNDTSLSSNALRTTNVQAPGTSGAQGTVNDGVTSANDNTGKNVTTNSNSNSENKSYQVAAAVGVNITVHRALVDIDGSITSGALDVLAENRGNFRTLGTGVGMSLADGSNAIAVGVAMSINHNGAVVTIANDAVINTTDDAAFFARLTQNQDGDYRGYLGAQALSGSVSGKDSAFSIGAAIASIITYSETAVRVSDGTSIAHAAFNVGGKLTIEANDKSKLALRAGGISVSKGASMGLGASFAVIGAYNVVAAYVGHCTSIQADEFVMLAQKQRVDIHDYRSAFGLGDLISDSSDLTEAERQDADTGIIDVHRGADEESYTVDINLSTDTVLALIDLANFLSSTNYYAEAIAGSVITETNSDGGSVAGAFTLVLFGNKVSAELGDAVDVMVVRDMRLIADNSANVRIIAGSLAAGGGTGVGLNFGFFLNADFVSASIGGGAVIQTGSYAQKAITSADVLVITIACAAISSSSSSAAVGGALNVLSATNVTHTTVGERSRITATAGDIDVTAANDILLIFVSASVSVSVSGSGVAVGGTVGVAANEAISRVDIKPYVELTSHNGSVHLDASATEWLIHLISSVSGAAQGTSVAAVLGVLGSYSDIRVRMGDNVIIRAKKDVRATASGTAVSVFGALGVSVSSAQVAVGATVMLDAFMRKISVITGENVAITAGGEVLLGASARDIAVLIAISASGSSSNVAVSGTIPFLLAGNLVQAETGRGNNIRADGSIGVSAYMRDIVVDTAGGVAISGGNTAVGATVTTGLFANIVTAKVGPGNVLYAKGLTEGVTLNRDDKRRGVIVSAVAKEFIIMIAVSGAATGGSTGVAGVISTFAARNRIEAVIESGGKIIAGLALQDPNEPPLTPESANAIKCSESDVIVEADDNTVIVNVAGGLGGASSTGVGATVAVVAFVKTINAFANGEIYAARDIIVSAYTSDNLWLLAVAFGAGGSTGVAGDLNTMLFYNSVEAYLSGTAVAGQNISVKAENHSVLVNVGAGLGAAGSTGVVDIALVTFFYSETKAAFCAGTARAGNHITIQAKSFEVVTADAAGIGAGGATGVGGVLDVILTKIVTRAYVGEDAKLYAGNNIIVYAKDDYILAAVLLNVAGGAEVGVSVSILATVSFNTVCAEILAGARLTAGGAITVEATSNRDAHSFVSTVGGGGTAGVTLSVSVMAVGSRLSQDAHDAIYSKSEKQVTHSSDGTDYFVYEDEKGNLYYKTAHGAWYTLGYEMTITADTVTNATETGYVFEDGTGVYRAYEANGERYYSKDKTAWFEKTERMTLLDDFDGSALKPYYNSTMDPQTQSDAAFAQGNQKALAIGDKKPADGSLTVALMGEKDGKNAAAIGADFDDFGQQSDDAAKKVIREEAYETVGGEIVEAYVYRNSANETIYRSIKNDALVYKKNSDGKLTSYTGSTAGYEPDYVIATVRDNRNGNDDTYELYKMGQNDDGTRYYKRDGQFYSRKGEAFVADDTIDTTALVPVYLVRTVGEADINQATGEVGEMKQDNYDEKTEQVQVKSDSFEPLSEALSDGTGAIVRTGAILTTTNTMGFGDINVLASDLMISNLISGGLAIGAAGAGVGVGLSVMVLFSDVEAVVEDGAALSAADDVHIIASSGKPATVPESNASIDTRTVDGIAYYHYKDATGNSYYYSPIDGKLYRIDAAEHVTLVPNAENERLQSEGLTLQSSGKEDPRGVDAMLVLALVAEKLGIRQDNSVFMVGVTGSGGACAGVSVTLGALFVFSRVNAQLLGDVVFAKNVDVGAVMDFGNVVTATAGIAIGGGAGVTVSAGFTFFMGEITAAICGNADVTATQKVSVTTGGTTKASAGAAGVAGGTVGVGVNIALAVNTTCINTYIAQGVTVYAREVLVTSTFDTKGAAYLMTATVGGVSVGVGVAFVLGVTLSNVYIGKPGNDASDEAVRGTIHSDTVTVTNDLSTDMYVAGMGLSVGAVAVDVIVALAFNYTAATAAINRMHMDAGDILVRSSLHGGTEVVTTSLTGGGVAVGVSVALGFLRTKNDAFVDVTNSRIQANNLRVYAGDYEHPADSVALVTLVAGVGGLISVGVNFGIAINASANKAAIFGHVDPGALIVTGNMKSEAVSRARAFSISANVVWAAIGVNPSIAFALLISQQDACIELTGAPVTVGTADVVSKQNTGFDTSITDAFGASTLKGTGASDQPITFTSMAEAFIFSGAGGLLSVTPNIAFAIAAATGDAWLSAPALTVTGLLNVQSIGSAVANVNIDNLPGALLSVGVMVGVATAGGGFTATLTSAGSIRAGSINVETTYRGAANTVVIPASAGMSVSLCTYNVTAANSLVVTVASARMTGAERGYTVTADGAANVTVNGSVRAYATVGTPYFTVAAILTAFNEAGAEAAAVQKAEITGVTLHAGAVNVASNLNKSGAADEGAFAELGKNSNILTQVLEAAGSIPTVNFTLALVARNDNIALANNQCVSTAAIHDASVHVTNELNVLADGVARANANVTATASVGLLYIGLTTTFAYADGTFRAYIDNAAITADTVSVDNSYQAEAKAETMQPNGGVGLRFAAASVTTNTATALVRVSAESLLLEGANIKAGTVNVSVNGLATAFAGKINPVATVSALEIAASMFTATNAAIQNAGIDGATVEADAIHVTASLNGDGRKAAEARLAVPQNAVTVSLVGVGVHTALANAITQSYAWMRGVISKGSPALTITSAGSSVAAAKVGQSDTSLGLYAAGLATLEAYANGAFAAYIDTNRYDAEHNVIGTVDMQSADVTVATDVTAQATAVVSAPEGGIPSGMDLTLYQVKTNIALAIVQARSSAYITGGGSVIAAGDIAVTAQTRALAEASSVKKQSAGSVNIAANVLTATVGSVQKAYIAGTKVSGANITVRAQYNDGAQAGGATAILDGNGTTHALASAAVNTAIAKDDAESCAYVEYAGVSEPVNGYDLITTGILRIESVGNARAEARTLQGSAMGALMMGVTVVTADANGTFYAGERIGSRRRIKASKQDVRTTYTARANATTAQSGVKETGASAQTNAAAASVGADATAEIAGDGDGSGETDGDGDGISVIVDGTAQAVAGVYNAAGISLTNAAINTLTATVAAKQAARIQDVTIAGADAVQVLSYFNVDRAGAEAGTLNATGGAYAYMNAGGSVAAGNATGNMATAEITAQAAAQIINASIGNATRRGRVLVHSYGASVAKAQLETEAAAALMGAGCNRMTANSNAKFTALIDTNGAIYAESADIFTHYTTESYAVTSDGTLSVSGVTAQINSATATAGSEAGAYLAGDGRLDSSGVLDGTNVGVRVRSKGDAQSEALYSKVGSISIFPRSPRRCLRQRLKPSSMPRRIWRRL